MDDNMTQTVITIGLSKDMLDKISTYQHANKISSRVEAIRQMVALTYETWSSDCKTQS